MIKATKIYKLIEIALRSLSRMGTNNKGYLMLQEPQTFCLVSENDEFDISADERIWEKGTQRKQAACISLSILGCNLPDRERRSPEGVKTITGPDLDYKMWEKNFHRCYNDLNALKSGDPSMVNSCVYTMVNPLTMHKPCVIYAQFGIFDNRLQLIVNARATHLFMLYENIFRYMNLQILFASLIGFSLGDLFFVSDNFHVLDGQQKHLKSYQNLRSEIATYLCSEPLTLNQYDKDRRYIRSHDYDMVVWPVFRDLLDLKERDL
jgi:hypothetical protein